jgi:hypothetical protein
MTRAQARLTTSGRLQRHLQVLECRYPRVWEQIDAIRRAHAGSGSWPSWCHVPLARVRDVVCPEEAGDDPTRLVDVAIVGGLAAWRVHQELCPSDRTESAPDDPPDLDVSPDHLRTLLHRPIYIELPQSSLGSPATGATRGVLVHLTYDDRTQVSELRLLIDPTRRWTLGSVPLVPIALPLTEPTLARCLEATVREHVRRHERLARYAVAGEMAIGLHGLARACVGLAVQLLDPTRSLSLPLSDSQTSDLLASDLHASGIARHEAPRAGAHIPATGGARAR